MNISFRLRRYVKFVLNLYGELITKDIYVDVRRNSLKIKNKFGFRLSTSISSWMCFELWKMFKRSNKTKKNNKSSKSSKWAIRLVNLSFSDEKLLTIFPSSSLSGSFSVDNLMQPPFTVQQRVFIRRSTGGSSTLFNGIMMNVNGTTTRFCCMKINNTQIMFFCRFYVCSVCLCEITKSL
jgi:hypothetical protein